jgi:hypothetical protein
MSSRTAASYSLCFQNVIISFKMKVNKSHNWINMVVSSYREACSYNSEIYNTMDYKGNQEGG